MGISIIQNRVEKQWSRGGRPVPVLPTRRVALYCPTFGTVGIRREYSLQPISNNIPWSILIYKQLENRAQQTIAKILESPVPDVRQILYTIALYIYV